MAEIPETLGNYKILRKIGSGGMADVYLASFVAASGFEKRVALKVMKSEFASNQEFVQSFIEEAKLAALMDHQNIVPVKELGNMKGVHFIVMDYMNARTLLDLFKRATAEHDISPPLAAHIVSCVCAGIHYAHVQSDLEGQPLRLIHRDLSPQNVLISMEGVVKITDFGVAKAMTNLIKTHPGVVKGKINYMSPEQIAGLELDQRSDIFSIGILLYEMVCRQPAFDGDGQIIVMQKIKTADYKRPKSVDPEIPDEYASVIEKSMSQDPKDRYQTAEEMQLVLEDMCSKSGVRHPQIELRKLMTALFPPGLDSPESKRDKVEEVMKETVKDKKWGMEGDTVLQRFGGLFSF